MAEQAQEVREQKATKRTDRREALLLELNAALAELVSDTAEHHVSQT